MNIIDWKNINIKELAAIVSTQLQNNDIDAVLVGGACASIYSKNEYMSYDLDYVSYNSVKEIKPVLEELGFKQEGKNRFINKKCKFYIELVSPPVGIGKQVPIEQFSEIDSKEGKIVLFTPTDCVKDRLSAYYHWSDPQSLEQAIMVAKNQKINIKEIELWSRKENKLEEFNKFKDILND